MMLVIIIIMKLYQGTNKQINKQQWKTHENILQVIRLTTWLHAYSYRKQLNSEQQAYFTKDNGLE